MDEIKMIVFTILLSSFERVSKSSKWGKKKKFHRSVLLERLNVSQRQTDEIDLVPKAHPLVFNRVTGKRRFLCICDIYWNSLNASSSTHVRQFMNNLTFICITSRNNS